MRTSIARIRGALLLALAWAVAWAPAGVLLGMVLDPDGSMDEPWPAVGAYPGFLSGAVFFTLSGLGSGRGGLDQASLWRAGALGAVSGLLVILLPFLGLLGTPNTEHALWRLRLLIVGGVTLLSSGSAVGSALLARALKKGGLRGGTAGVA